MKILPKDVFVVYFIDKASSRKAYVFTVHDNKKEAIEKKKRNMTLHGGFQWKVDNIYNFTKKVYMLGYSEGDSNEN